MRGRSLHMFGALAAAAATALALVAAPVARAGNPQVNHFEFAFAFTWIDFCGTGADVGVSGAYHGTEFLPVDERVLLEGKTVYVNPLNGNTVTLQIADATWSTTVSGDAEGLHVVESTTTGLGHLSAPSRAGCWSAMPARSRCARPTTATSSSAERSSSIAEVIPFSRAASGPSSARSFRALSD